MSPSDRIGRNPFQKNSPRTSTSASTATPERAPRKRASKPRASGAKRTKASNAKQDKNLLLALRELLLQILAELKRSLLLLLGQMRPLRARA